MRMVLSAVPKFFFMGISRMVENVERVLCTNEMIPARFRVTGTGIRGKGGGTAPYRFFSGVSRVPLLVLLFRVLDPGAHSRLMVLSNFLCVAAGT